MKTFIIFLSILLASSLNAQEVSSPTTFQCHNPRVLAQPIQLIFFSDRWSIQTKTEECALSLVENQNTSPNYEDWMFLATDSDKESCQTQTRFNPPSQRKIRQISLSPALQNFESGFLQITFDNSAAEYGTKVIKTFLKCR